MEIQEILIWCLLVMAALLFALAAGITGNYINAMVVIGAECVAFGLVLGMRYYG